MTSAHGATCHTVDVVIRSYFRDVDLLRTCLASLQRFARGHRRTVVIVPASTERRLDLSWVEGHERVVLTTCEDFDDDYVGQQITKLHADRFTDADIVLFVDSDHRLTAPCSLPGRIFKVGGRLRQYVGGLSARAHGDGWRRCPERFFEQPFDRDLAGPLPFTVPRAAFEGLRNECLKRHGKTLHEYCVALTGDALCEVALFSGWMLLYAGDSVCWDADPLLPECETPWSRAAGFDRRTRI